MADTYTMILRPTDRQPGAKPMKITLLGTGSPIPDPNRAGPSTLVATRRRDAARRLRARAAAAAHRRRACSRRC